MVDVQEAVLATDAVEPQVRQKWWDGRWDRWDGRWWDGFPFYFYDSLLFTFSQI